MKMLIHQGKKKSIFFMIKVSVQNIVEILLGDCLFLLRNSLFGVYLFIYIKLYIIKYYIALYYI